MNIYERFYSEKTIDKIFLIFVFASALFLDGFKNDRIFFVYSLFFLFFFWFKKISINVNGYFVGFLIFSFLSSVFSESPALSIAFFLKLLISSLFYFYLKEFHNLSEIKKFFEDLLYVFSVFISIIIFYRFLMAQDIVLITKNINIPGVFVGCGILIGIYRFLENKKIKYILFLLLQISVIFIINSRAVYISVLLAVYLMLWQRIGFRKTLFLYVFLMVCYGLFMNQLLFYNLKLFDYKSYFRLKIYKTAFEIFINFPLTGVGTGLFQHGFELFKFPFFNGFTFFNHTTFHAHNEFLNILSENGIFGFLFYSFFLFRIFYTNIKSKKLTLMFYALLFFTVVSFFDIFLFLVFSKIVYFAVLGIVDNEKSSIKVNFKEIVFPVIFFMLIICGLSLNKNNFQIDRANLKNAYYELQNSSNIIYRCAFSNYELRFHPYNMIFRFEEAKYYFDLKRYDESEKILNYILKYEPYFSNAILMKAYIHMLKGDKKTAGKLIKRVFKNKTKPSTFYDSFIYNIDLNIYNYLNKEIYGTIQH